MLKMKCHEIANPLFLLLVLRVGTNYSITVINKTVTSRFIGYCICIAYYLFKKKKMLKMKYHEIANPFFFFFFVGVESGHKLLYLSLIKL